MWPSTHRRSLGGAGKEMLGVTEAVDSVMMNIGAFFTIAGGIIMMLFVVGMVGYLVALLWISACNKWRAICRAESLIFEYRKNRKDFLRWMSKADTIAAEKKAADVRPVVRGRWVKIGSPAPSRRVLLQVHENAGGQIHGIGLLPTLWGGHERGNRR